MLVSAVNWKLYFCQMNSSEAKFKLGLSLPTDPRWADSVEEHLSEILTDHAYCEQKAASTCISIITQYPDLEQVVEALIPVVKEEWEHFDRVVKLIKSKGFKLGKQRSDEYVIALQKCVRKGGSRTQQLTEKLLICAMIEARSCERFRSLWKGLKDKELSDFYYELMVSEAGHYRLFLTLAKHFMPSDYVEKRWEEIRKEEAEIIRKLPARGSKIH